MENLSREKIEEIASEEKRIIAVHFFEHDAYSPFDYGAFRTERITRRREAAVRAYIDAPAIEDVFDVDHASRRAWKDSIGKRKEGLIAMVNEDPMRANNIMGAHQSFDELLRGYRWRDDVEILKKKIAKLGDAFPDNYAVLPFGRKLEAVQYQQEGLFYLINMLASISQLSAKFSTADRHNTLD